MISDLDKLSTYESYDLGNNGWVRCFTIVAGFGCVVHYRTYDEFVISTVDAVIYLRIHALLQRSNVGSGDAQTLLKHCPTIPQCVFIKED